jgi:hypothetical protein
MVDAELAVQNMIDDDDSDSLIYDSDLLIYITVELEQSVDAY